MPRKGWSVPLSSDSGLSNTESVFIYGNNIEKNTRLPNSDHCIFICYSSLVFIPPRVISSLYLARRGMKAVVDLAGANVG